MAANCSLKNVFVLYYQLFDAASAAINMTKTTVSNSWLSVYDKSNHNADNEILNKHVLGVALKMSVSENSSVSQIPVCIAVSGSDE